MLLTGPYANILPETSVRMKIAQVCNTYKFQEVEDAPTVFLKHISKKSWNSKCQSLKSEFIFSFSIKYTYTQCYTNRMRMDVRDLLILFILFVV